MAMSSAARLGTVLGCVVLVGTGSIGAVIWQGNTFDAVFDDLSVRLANEAQREGFTLVAEESGRTWHSRDISLRFSAPGIDLQWKGTADFGWGTTATLLLDTDYGTAADFEKLGIVGYEDSIVLESGLKGLVDGNFDWRWSAKPFTFNENGVPLCEVGGMSLNGGGDLTSARFVLDGIRAGEGAIKISSGRITGDFKADSQESRNSSVLWKMMSFNYEDNYQKVAIGESSVSVSAKVTSAKGEPVVYQLDYGMDIGSTDDDGHRLWDLWKVRAEVHKVPEKLITSMAFHSPDQAFGVFAYMQYAFHRQGLTIHLPVNEWHLGDSQASFTGTLADTQEGLGSFDVVIDRAFAEKVPELKSETKAWLEEGLLREEEGRLSGRGKIDPNGDIFMNGVPL